MTQLKYTLPKFILPTTTDRAAYLAWRADWKKDYAELSGTIRLMKHNLKQAQREHHPNAHAAIRRQLVQASNLAGLALEYRAVGKVESAAAYRSTWADGTLDCLAAESGEAAMVASTAVRA
ncbi:hypothetical protein [Nevskia ramosa]|uniref:hypothetical protein n=1 Tax=Nevskia ramosa TaxID=64002 RepID=UPI0023527C94|nr:hypothetical protein [Nevskia ramosa]